jgi:hypothetical protein
MGSEQHDMNVLTMPGTQLALAVHIGSDGSVDNETVNLSKQAGEEIVWHSNGEEFEITFPVSPFKTQQFNVMSRQSTHSGPVRSDAGVGYYPYYITITSKGAIGDPGVNVKP